MQESAIDAIISHMKFSKPSELRVFFMGTPDIAKTVLESLIDAGFGLVGVLTQEDKPQGRKGILTPSPVKKVALEHGIPVFQPHRVRKEHDFINTLTYDIIVCIAYGQIVPKDILTSAPCGCFNLHGSILPEYRGAAPIQRAIIDGKEETGVSLMEMVEAMDAGRVYDIARMPIAQSDTYTSLSERMGHVAGELIVKDLLALANGELLGVSQDEAKVTIANKILPAEERLPLTLSVHGTDRLIHGLSETPGGYFVYANKKLKIYQSHPVSLDSSEEIGTISGDKKHLYLKLKDGLLCLDSIQLEGNKRMDAASFLNGHRDILGGKLE